MVEYKITEQMMESARDYVPIAEKAMFLSEAADECIKIVQIVYGDSAMPDMFVENSVAKQRFLLGALLNLYFKQEIEPIEGYKWFMSYDNFDRWERNATIPAIERMKSNKDFRDKAYNLLYDFRSLKKMLESEVHGKLTVMNDVLGRGRKVIESEFSPENFKQASEQIQEMESELAEFKKKHEEAK